MSFSGNWSCRRVLGVSGLCAAALLVSGTSGATVLDFETILNGEAGGFVIVAPEATVTISGSGPNLGVAGFDTDPTGPNSGAEDQDLLVDTGIALILQDSNEPAITLGIYDSPDDDADGGTISFLFSSAVTLLSLDLIDINGNGPATVTLFDSGGNSRAYAVPFQWTGDIDVGDVGIGTLDLTTLVAQAGVGPGNPLATASEIGAFDANDVVSLDVFFDGSAALDNLTFVPEPGTLAVLGLFLGAGLVSLRRR